MAFIMTRLHLYILTLAGVALGHALTNIAKGSTGIRKEWGNLTTDEQLDYINAVKCLRDRPSVVASSAFPGVKDRLDDFVVTHINYTFNIHQSGLLLPWHRHFLVLWETALQEECDYTGSLPYWNWALSAQNSSTSLMFGDGPTSIASNGVEKPDSKVPCDSHEGCDHPAGGGCIRSGPFKGFQVHLGPISTSYLHPYTGFPPNAFDYNPRCISRSVNFGILARNNNQTMIDSLLSAHDITEFQALLDPRIAGSDVSVIGPHAGGHLAIGMTMQDPFCSPQDPVFILHHGMVDRMWALWQAKDPDLRLSALNGTAMVADPPGFPEVTLDTVMEFGLLDSPLKVREVMDIRSYDYVYA